MVGNKWWVEALQWERTAEFNAAPEEVWEVNGAKAGTVQAAEPLSFVKIADAGHLVRCHRRCCQRAGLDLSPCHSFALH